MEILKVTGLNIWVFLDGKYYKVVDDISFSVYEREVLAIVGESGSGKSITVNSILKLVGENVKIEAKEIKYQGKDIKNISNRDIMNIRGKEISIVFQNPFNSLNPVFTIADQMIEALYPNRRIRKGSKEWDKGIEEAKRLLKEVEITEAERVLFSYPHQLSGGMLQRVAIAIAIARKPKILIADEPTTSLDVSVQAGILNLLLSLKQTENLSIIFITHDMRIVEKIADRVIVLYGGEIMESGDREEIFGNPLHPYTQALINVSRTHFEAKGKKFLETIPGNVPSIFENISGCKFHPRCPKAMEICSSIKPQEKQVKPNHIVSCHLY